MSVFGLVRRAHANRPRLMVYDTDGVNPYGRELAGLLNTFADVLYVSPSHIEWAPELSRMSLLGASTAKDGLVAHTLKRVGGVLAAVTIAAVTRRTIVVAWSRDWWDAFVLRWAGRAAPGLVVVNHNPTAIRATAGLRLRCERALKLAASATVVHSRALVAEAGLDSRRVIVAAHPPYNEWANRFAGDRAARSGPPTVAFLGSTRPDKGVHDFIGVVEQLETRPLRVCFLGKGELSASQREQLDSPGLEITGPFSRFLTDEELGRELSSCDVVVAPYRNVTQSGSVLLALTAGVPVSAYSGGGLNDLLSDIYLSNPGDLQALTRSVQYQIQHGDPGIPKKIVQSVTSQSKREWQSAIDKVQKH